MKLMGDIDVACKTISGEMSKMKKSLVPGGFYMLIRFYNTFLPQFFVDKVSKSGGSKYSMIFTNVPGFVKPVYFSGKPAKRLFYCGTASGNLSSGFSIVSVLDRAQLCVTSDESQIEDIPLLIKFINEEILNLKIQSDE